MIDTAKLLMYGAVTFVPASEFDTVSETMRFAGQVIDRLEPSEELPGFLAWFTPTEPVLAAPPADQPRHKIHDDPPEHG